MAIYFKVTFYLHKKTKMYTYGNIGCPRLTIRGIFVNTRNIIMRARPIWVTTTNTHSTTTQYIFLSIGKYYSGCII